MSCEKQVVLKLESEQQLNNTSSKQSRALCSTHCLDGDFSVDKNETVYVKEGSLSSFQMLILQCEMQ